VVHTQPQTSVLEHHLHRVHHPLDVARGLDGQHLLDGRHLLDGHGGLDGQRLLDDARELDGKRQLLDEACGRQMTTACSTATRTARRRLGAASWSPTRLVQVEQVDEVRRAEQHGRPRLEQLGRVVPGARNGQQQKEHEELGRRRSWWTA